MNKSNDTKTNLCAFSGCGGWAHGSKTGLCRKHQEMARFFVWMLDNIKISDENRTKSGIILPNDPSFRKPA